MRYIACCIYLNAKQSQKAKMTTRSMALAGILIIAFTWPWGIARAKKIEYDPREAIRSAQRQAYAQALERQMSIAVNCLITAAKAWGRIGRDQSDVIAQMVMGCGEGPRRVALDVMNDTVIAAAVQQTLIQAAYDSLSSVPGVRLAPLDKTKIENLIAAARSGRVAANPTAPQEGKPQGQVRVVVPNTASVAPTKPSPSVAPAPRPLKATLSSEQLKFYPSANECELVRQIATAIAVARKQGSQQSQVLDGLFKDSKPADVDYRRSLVPIVHAIFNASRESINDEKAVGQAYVSACIEAKGGVVANTDSATAKRDAAAKDCERIRVFTTAVVDDRQKGIYWEHMKVKIGKSQGSDAEKQFATELASSIYADSGAMVGPPSKVAQDYVDRCIERKMANNQ